VSKPPLYIDEGLRPIKPQNRSNQVYLLFLPYALRVVLFSPSLVSLYLKSPPLFSSMSTRDILGGLPTPRHTLGSFLPNGVPLGRRDLGLPRRRRPSAPSWIVRAPGANRPDICRGVVLRQVADRPTLCRGPSASPQRAPPSGPFQCLASRSAPR
jgi:hypothetical protein